MRGGGEEAENTHTRTHAHTHIFTHASEGEKPQRTDVTACGPLVRIGMPPPQCWRQSEFLTPSQSRVCVISQNTHTHTHTHTHTNTHWKCLAAGLSSFSNNIKPFLSFSSSHPFDFLFSVHPLLLSLLSPGWETKQFCGKRKTETSISSAEWMRFSCSLSR